MKPKLTRKVPRAVLSTLLGSILNVHVYEGHNNDLGCFNVTTLADTFGNESCLADWIEAMAPACVLADGGYNLAHVDGLLCPKHNPWNYNTHRAFHIAWEQEHAAMRAVVENVFSRVSNWKSCTYKQHVDHITQANRIIEVFWLVNEDLKDRPLRA